jgi:hypothetical protein
METKKKEKRKSLLLVGFLFLVGILFLISMGFIGNAKIVYKNENEQMEKIPEIPSEPVIPPIDTQAYDLKLKKLANNPPPKVVAPKIDPNTGQEILPPTPKPNLWPIKTVYPNAGAILPFKRVVAYYGNLYSTKMGALGEYQEEEMLKKLIAEKEKWETADPETPVVPALHYITVVAQAGAGVDGKYRARMPDTEIEKVLAMAKKIDAIVFLDIQAGFSNIQTELPLLEKYLKMKEVNIGIDPEFYMKTDVRPGKVIGTLDATEINFAIDYLAKIVKENNLTPKILVIYRFTQNMITNYKNIKVVPEVQFVMNMDGWGGKAKKKNTYQQFVYKEPVQFTGFKLFYKNDIKEAGTTLFTPEELLKLNPRPIYIQYQ